MRESKEQNLSLPLIIRNLHFIFLKIKVLVMILKNQKIIQKCLASPKNLGWKKKIHNL
jgi:hypothetical protein